MAACDDPDRQLQRLRWQCRRGMLELDLLLHAFIERGYGDLDSDGRRDFERLLGLPDQVIHDWLMGPAVPEEAAMQALVERVLVAIRAPGPGDADTN